MVVHSFNTKSCYCLYHGIYLMPFIFAVVIKSKYGMKIDVEQEIRMAKNDLIPKSEKLCSAQQVHISCFYWC